MSLDAAERRIRPATPADVEGVMNVLRVTMPATYVRPGSGLTTEQCFPESVFANMQPSLVEQLTPSGVCRAWVVMGSGQSDIQGVLTTVEEGSHVEIPRLYLAMSVIGNGIGRLLLQSAFDSWGEDRAYELEVLQYNRRAIAFYKRNGFWEVPGVLVDYSVTDTMDDWPIAHLDPKHRAKRMHREPIIEV